MWSLSVVFTSAFKRLDAIPQFKATAKLGEFQNPWSNWVKKGCRSRRESGERGLSRNYALGNTKRAPSDRN